MKVEMEVKDAEAKAADEEEEAPRMDASFRRLHKETFALAVSSVMDSEWSDESEDGVPIEWKAWRDIL